MALHYGSSLSGMGVNNNLQPVFKHHRLSTKPRANPQEQSYRCSSTRSEKHEDSFQTQLAAWLAYLFILDQHHNSRLALQTQLLDAKSSFFSSSGFRTSQHKREKSWGRTSTRYSRSSKNSCESTIRTSSSAVINTTWTESPSMPKKKALLVEDQSQPPILPKPQARQDSFNPSLEDSISSDAGTTSSSSSEVSSPPSELGPTPQGLSHLHFEQSRDNAQIARVTRDGSPIRRSQRNRKAPSLYANMQTDASPTPAKRKRGMSASSSNSKSSPSSAVKTTDERYSKKSRSLSSSDRGSAGPKRSSRESPLQSQDISTPSRSITRSSNISTPSVSPEDQLLIQKRPYVSLDHAKAYSYTESYLRSEPLPDDSRSIVNASKNCKRAVSAAIELDIATAFCAKMKKQQYINQTNEGDLETYFFQSQRNFKASEHNHSSWKSENLYPMFEKDNPTYYGADGLTRYTGPPGVQHSSQHESEAPSPPARRGSRGGWRGRGSGYGRGRGRGRGGGLSGGSGGRDRGESPDPPHKPNLGPEDKLVLSHIRMRQAELKRFFALLATQQGDILGLLVNRDLTKLARKANNHTRVPEFQDICDEIDERKEMACELAKRRFDYEKKLADDTLQREQNIVESYFRIRVEESQQEHIKGAEGDLIIFKNAHNSANDETHTEAGSDVGCYFPRYHECPEPDATVRGYTSTNIRDEKSLKVQLTTYDEEAQREVIDDDVFVPMAKSIAHQNEERKKAEEKEKTQTIDELANVAEDELKRIGGYLIPRPIYASENPQFALSRLADASEYAARAHPEQSYIFMPIAGADTRQIAADVVRSEPPPASHLPPPQFHPQNTIPPPPPKRPASKKQKPMSDASRRPSRPGEHQNGVSTPGTNQLPAIAPAPMRLPPPPPSPIYLAPLTTKPPSHQTMYSMPPPPPMLPLSAHSRHHSQSFTFTPAQTPGQSYFTPNATPQPVFTSTTGHTKLHNTFVNQTIESRYQADMARENAARTQGQGAGPKGGKRILLPKGLR